MLLKFTLNGKPVELHTNPETRLIDLLRNHFSLTGTKEVCGEGECGACTISFNGEVMLSCLIPASKVENADVKTIENLSPKGIPNYIQKAFIDSDALQCGFCTPGLIMSVQDYIEKNGSLDDDSIKKALSGNLCRCTGYVKVIEAVKLAIKYRKDIGNEDN